MLASGSSSEAIDPTSYRLSGTGGHAKSTITGRGSALVHFNDFLTTKKMSNFADLSQRELCSIQLFQEYGTYLSEHARHKKKVSYEIITVYP